MSGSEYKVGAVISHRITGANDLRDLTNRWKKFREEVGSTHPTVKKMDSAMSKMKIGGGLLAAGGVMAGFALSTVKARTEISGLEADIRSLKVSSAAVDEISAAGSMMAAKMGIAKNTYLTGIYSIKSAVSSLEGSELSDFAGIVAKTAMATKGDFAQLSSSFGMVHANYRKMYSGVSEKDFASLVGNSLSMAVQKYRTDGAGMNQAMQSLSTAASGVNISFAEQTAVLGTLQNKMSAGESGTAYRAFLGKIGTGMKNLGLNANDASGKLKSMPAVLADIRAKFGDNIDAVTEMPQLIKSFGEEGAKAVVGLLPTINQLTADITDIDGAIKAGDWSAMNTMASERLNSMPAQLSRLSEGWKALMGDLGKGADGPISGVVGGLADIVGWILATGKEHPMLMKVASTILFAGTALVLVTGAVMTARGAWMAYSIMQNLSAGSTATNAAASGSMGVIQSALAIKTGIVTAAQWAWNAAITANPIGLIIVGVAALIAGVILLVTYWDEIRSYWTSMPGWAKVVVGAFFPIIGIIMVIADVVGYLGTAWEQLGGDTTSVWEKIKGAWSGAPAWVRGIIGLIMLPLLPFIFLGKLIYDNWSGITGFVGGIWDGIVTSSVAFGGWIWGWISGLGESLWGWISSMGDTAGVKLMMTLVGGITKGTKYVWGAVKKALGFVGNLLPHSDAKEGPLSTLTASGQSIPRTLAEGVTKEQSKVPDAMQPALRNFARPVRPSLNDSQLAGLNGGNTGNSFGALIQNLTIKAGQGMSLREFTEMMARAVYSEIEKTEALA